MKTVSLPHTLAMGHPQPHSAWALETIGRLTALRVLAAAYRVASRNHATQIDGAVPLEADVPAAYLLRRLALV